MMDLAANYGEGPVSLKRIAERHQLSEHYLEQLIAPLRNAGLVKSVRGAYGGYKLSKAPEDITAGEVIRVLEGPIILVDVEEENDAPAETVEARRTPSLSAGQHAERSHSRVFAG